VTIIKLVCEHEIEPYLDLLAEVEHIKLDRKNPNHEQWLRRRIQSHFERGALFYAYHEDELSDAFGIVAVLHEEAPNGIPALGARAEVLDIGVCKDHRRKGIGGILLHHVENIVKGRGAYCLIILTYAEDYDVIAFYGKNGYVPVATIPDVFGPGAEGNTVLRKLLR
jgi:GNAT superfamily N-acetyltransferase